MINELQKTVSSLESLSPEAQKEVANHIAALVQMLFRLDRDRFFLPHIKPDKPLASPAEAKNDLQESLGAKPDKPPTGLAKAESDPQEYPSQLQSAKGPLEETLAKIRQLPSWGENCNSYQTLAINPSALSHAESWISSFFQMIEEDPNLTWMSPSVTPSPEGEVIFEWWCREKKLTIYVADQSVDYVQVWGTDVKAKITDGEIESISDSRSLWIWLTSENND